jgi:hypothetical protein
MIGYTGVKLLLAELSIAYIIIASSHNRRRPFQFLTNRRRNGRQNLILEREKERERVLKVVGVDACDNRW